MYHHESDFSNRIAQKSASGFRHIVMRQFAAKEAEVIPQSRSMSDNCSHIHANSRIRDEFQRINLEGVQLHREQFLPRKVERPYTRRLYLEVLCRKHMRDIE
jgi:hypothetical protein